MTGTCTDLGLIAGRYIQAAYKRLKCSHVSRQECDRIDREAWKEKYYLVLLLGFYLGVLVGAVLYIQLRDFSVLIPMTALLLMLIVQFMVVQLREQCTTKTMRLH